MEPCKLELWKMDPCKIAPCEVDPCEIAPCKMDPCEISPCQMDPCEIAPCDITYLQKTPICQNAHLPKCTFAKMHICQNAHLPKCTFAKMHICQNASLPKCFFAKMLLCKKSLAKIRLQDVSVQDVPVPLKLLQNGQTYLKYFVCLEHLIKIHLKYHKKYFSGLFFYNFTRRGIYHYLSINALSKEWPINMQSTKHMQLFFI